MFEDGELFGEVAREEGQEGDYWEENVGYEGVGASAECGCEAGVCQCWLYLERGGYIDRRLTSVQQLLLARCRAARSC